MLTNEPATEPAEPTGDHPVWRRPALLAAAAAAVVAVGLGGMVLQGGDNPAKPAKTLALTVPGGDGATMNSCMMFDVAILKGMPVAFAGTVTAVTDNAVTLDVDRWYKGGDATVVALTTQGQNVALDGVEFTQGTRYLVTATDGAVNSCGYTGPASAELEASFAEAFTP